MGPGPVKGRGLFLSPAPTMGIHTMEGYYRNNGQQGESRADLAVKPPRRMQPLPWVPSQTPFIQHAEVSEPSETLSL